MHCLYVPCHGHEGGSASAAIDAISSNGVVPAVAHSRRSAIAGAAGAGAAAAATAAGARKYTDSSTAAANDVFGFC